MEIRMGVVRCWFDLEQCMIRCGVAVMQRDGVRGAFVDRTRTGTLLQGCLQLISYNLTTNLTHVDDMPMRKLERSLLCTS